MRYEVLLPEIVKMTQAGSGIDLIARALRTSAYAVRDALHLHRTGKRPPGRVDGRRRQGRQPSKPFVPKYQKMAAEVDRRRKAGEVFDRLAREMNVSRNTVVRAYDFGLPFSFVRIVENVIHRRPRGPEADPSVIQVERGVAGGPAKAPGATLTDREKSRASVGLRPTDALSCAPLSLPRDLNFEIDVIHIVRRNCLVHASTKRGELMLSGSICQLIPMPPRRLYIRRHNHNQSTPLGPHKLGGLTRL